MNIRFRKYGLIFRTVKLSDAERIVELRNDEKLGKYLNSSDGSITKQEEWLQQYFLRAHNGSEFYFATTNENESIVYGFNRLYKIVEDSFEIGSWIFDKDAPSGVAILSDLAVRDYAFETLNKKCCFFEVRKNNASVVKYHLAFKPQKIDEDEQNSYYKIDYLTYIQHRNKLLNILL